MLKRLGSGGGGRSRGNIGVEGDDDDDAAAVDSEGMDAEVDFGGDAQWPKEGIRVDELVPEWVMVKRSRDRDQDP